MANDQAIALDVQPGDLDVANALKSAAAIQQARSEAARNTATIPLIGQQTNQLAIQNDFQRQLNQAKLNLYNGAGDATTGAPTGTSANGPASASAPNGLAAAANAATPNGSTGSASGAPDPTGVSSPSAGGALNGNFIGRYSYLDPQGAKAMADTWASLDTNARANWSYRLGQIGRVAESAAAFPSGSKQQMIAWNEGLTELHNANSLDDASYTRLAGAPNQLL